MMKQPAPGSARHSFKCPGVGSIPILTLCIALSASAAEVYTWTDENGVQHFSDTPREGGAMQTLQVDEIYRPGSSDAYSAPEAAPEQPPAMPGQAEAEAEAPKTAAEARREAMAENRSQRREQQAETERLCALHRQRLEQMEPARRVFFTDESGEQVRMDDDQRMALIDESRAYVDSNCNG